MFRFQCGLRSHRSWSLHMRECRMRALLNGRRGMHSVTRERDGVRWFFKRARLRLVHGLCRLHRPCEGVRARGRHIRPRHRRACVHLRRRGVGAFLHEAEHTLYAGECVHALARLLPLHGLSAVFAFERRCGRRFQGSCLRIEHTSRHLARAFGQGWGGGEAAPWRWRSVEHT